MSEIGYEGSHIEQAILENGEVVCCSSGTSMYPMLRHRKDMVVVKKVDRPLKKYDVPLYRLKSGKLVLHRILKVTENGYIIRGDNLIKKELDITDDNIIGVLKGFTRFGKYFNCETSKIYKVYIRLNRLIFPMRFIWKKIMKPFLSKFKRVLLGRK